jgi:hypothetical protein
MESLHSLTLKEANRRRKLVQTPVNGSYCLGMLSELPSLRMQIQDFLKVYQAKSDDELLQLAAVPEHLTSEALIALQSELSRRRISIAESSGLSKKDQHWHAGDRITSGENLRSRERQGVPDFVAEVLRTYHNHFWLFFKITAPAVVISTFAILMGRNEGREIVRHLPQGFELLANRIELVEIVLINFSAYLLSWIAFSVSFAAICAVMRQISAGSVPSVQNSLMDVRERLAAFLRLSLLLFVLMLVAEAISVLLSSGVFWVLRHGHVRPTHLLIAVVSYGVVALALLVLSRFALAIPAVILDDCKVGQAMFRSDELTEGKWLTLAVLLAKSLIGGYVAALCPFWLASVIHVTTPLPSWFPWILTVASIIGVTVVEPTMFVGFALLYLKTSALGSPPSRILASQLA